MVVPAGGLTVILAPVPSAVPPQEPVYHCQLAPVPRLPPFTVRVLDVPLQVLLFVMVMPVGAVDRLPTVTASVPATLVPQELEAVTLMLPSCPVVPEVTVIEVVF